MRSMANLDRGAKSARSRAVSRVTPRGRRSFRKHFVLLAVSLLLAPGLLYGHSPTMDGRVRDWCYGTPSNTAARTEDSAASLTCGNCSLNPSVACLVNADCVGLPVPPYPAANAGTCQNVIPPTGPSKTNEIVFWDNRTDGAVNDLGSVAITWNNTNLYVSAELWVDPDPSSLPFGQLAIDFKAAGLDRWHDPFGMLRRAGTCSTSTTRACAKNADCHFCAVSTEPFPSTRPRACGSGCDPNNPADVCNTTQTCTGLGTPLKDFVGRYSNPSIGADYLLLFDFSLWLLSAGDAVLVMQPGQVIDPSNPWDPVLGCTPDFPGDSTACDFAPFVNPGASGGSGGPPGGVEVTVPWSVFGGQLNPGDAFRFALMVARGTTTLDFTPDGAIEDVMSEPVAGVSTRTSNSCPGMGIGTTNCEIADASQDAFVPRLPSFPYELAAGGRVGTLFMDRNAGASITLDWGNSCSSIDTDYAVYEGTLGSFFNHVPVAGLCSTGGATTATFNAASGNRYYLVVPTAGSSEGSYGAKTLAPNERPASTSPCAPSQVLGSCY